MHFRKNRHGFYSRDWLADCFDFIKSNIGEWLEIAGWLIFIGFIFSLQFIF